MKIHTFILLVAALAGLLAGCGRGPDPGPAAGNKAAEPVAAGATAVPEDSVAWAPSNQPTAVLMVNESPYAEIGAGCPVFVGCRISNPQDDADLPLASGKEVFPRLAGGPDGAAPTWEFLTEEAGSLPPRTGAGLLWRLTAPLPPGEYRVELDSSALIPTNISLHLRPALLTITPHSCDPRLAARCERRLLLLQGKTREYLEAVQAARAANPDDGMLLKEEADSLESAGRNEEALQKLSELGEKMMGRLPTNALAEPPEWLVFRMELLQDKIGRQAAAAGKAGASGRN